MGEERHREALMIEAKRCAALAMGNFAAGRYAVAADYYARVVKILTILGEPLGFLEVPDGT